MCDLLLVEVSKKYEKQAMVYRQDYISHGEKHINGNCISILNPKK